MNGIYLKNPKLYLLSCLPFCLRSLGPFEIWMYVCKTAYSYERSCFAPRASSITNTLYCFFFSFERYIRICFYCQLRETYVLSDENVKFYKLFIVIFPILFYIPKFFEVRSHYVDYPPTFREVCTNGLWQSSIYENLIFFKCFPITISHPFGSHATLLFLQADCNKLTRLKIPKVEFPPGHNFTEQELHNQAASYIINKMANGCREILLQVCYKNSLESCFETKLTMNEY